MGSSNTKHEKAIDKRTPSFKKSKESVSSAPIIIPKKDRKRTCFILTKDRTPPMPIPCARSWGYSNERIRTKPVENKRKKIRNWASKVKDISPNLDMNEIPEEGLWINDMEMEEDDENDYDL